MARIFITGSTDGLGRAAARSLIDDGHQVVLHARSSDRAAALADLASRAAGLVVGDLRSGGETKSLAEQVNTVPGKHCRFRTLAVFGGMPSSQGLQGGPAMIPVRQDTDAQGLRLLA